MSKRFTSINIHGVNFELDNKETVKNPVVFYKSVYECYGRCSHTKQLIWELWSRWFNDINSHMYGVTSHNSNFFTISGCVTWIDEETKEPVEYFLVITAAHNRAWRVERV